MGLVALIGPGLREPLGASSEQVLRLLWEGKLGGARNALETVQSADERLFFRGYLAFEQRRWRTARDLFQRLLSRFPDSSRRRDALYYLDRIKLRGIGETPPPEIRVKLAVSTSFRSRANGVLLVRKHNGSLVLRIDPGQPYSVRTRPGGVELTADQTVVGKALVLSPPGTDGTIQLGETSYRGKLVFRVKNRKVLAVNHLPLNRYLYGVVRKEIAPDWPMATVRAQAVAARSFALFRMKENRAGVYDLDATRLSQVYGGVEAETRRVLRAVEQTRGEVLVHRGRVVPAFFHANSGGHIETASSVWEQMKTPYIQPRPDTWSRGTKYARWTTDFSRRRINRALETEGYPPIAPGGSLGVSRRLPSGRATRIRYQSVRGPRRIRADRFRLALDPEILRSTWFVRIESGSSRIRFQGRGWGHGVGMSQWGARNMAQAGASYRDILRFYYAGARVAGQYGPSYLVRGE